MLSLTRNFRPRIQFRTHYDRGEQFDKTLEKMKTTGTKNSKVVGKTVNIDSITAKTVEINSRISVDPPKAKETVDAPKIESIDDPENDDQKAIDEKCQSMHLKFQKGLVATCFLMVAAIGSTSRSKNPFWNIVPSSFNEDGIAPPFQNNILKCELWDTKGNEITIEIDMRQKDLDYYKSKIDYLYPQGLRKLLYQLSLSTKSKQLSKIRLVIDYIERHLDTKK
jgi:hypothetical protein